MVNNKKRIEWIDMARGLGIIFIMFAHIDHGIIRKWLYTFHLPIFIILSGYLFNEKDNFSNFIKNKFKTLIIPYICLGIPMIIFDGIYRYSLGEYTVNDIISLIPQFVLQQRFWTLWYMACLFFLNIYFYYSKKILKTNFKMGILAIISFCIGLLYCTIGKFIFPYVIEGHLMAYPFPWNIDACLMAYPFFYVGYIYRQKCDYIDEYINKKNISGMVFIICLLINVVSGYLTHKISGEGLEMYYSAYGMPLFTYISAFSGVFCIFQLSKKFNLPFVKYVGANTMIYYTWHQTIFIPLSEMFFNLFNFSINSESGTLIKFIYEILQVIVMLVLLTICNIIIKKSKFKFILG